MSRQLPHLAMDGVLCDRPQEGCVVGKFIYARDNRSNSRKEKTMSNIMTDQQVQSHAAKLVKKLLGQDAAMDDETAGRIKEFLSGKLSAADHERVCSMLSGEDGAEDIDMPENAVGKPIGEKTPGAKVLAGDASFHALYPDAARVRIDNGGIALPKRTAGPSAADVASFNSMFPDSKRIKLA